MRFIKVLAVLSGLLVLPAGVQAQQNILNQSAMSDIAAQQNDDGTNVEPPELLDLQQVPGLQEKGIDPNEPMPFNIRKEAMKEAGLSYGARGGLARRTYEIRTELARRNQYLDKVYDFRQLLIAAPSGMFIEPPVISESLDALLIDGGGTEAAVADTIYNINKNARIVSAGKNWRTYLEREWGKVEPPPDILLPRNAEEREYWKELVSEGWQQGIKQADEIFEADLNRLNADFSGQVRYRQLLAKGMVTPPYTVMVDRGVSGGGQEMKIGDRAVRMTGLPSLKPKTDSWQPVNP